MKIYIAVNGFILYKLVKYLFKSLFIVPSKNKKDQRSIEQTLADIRAKKRKLEMNNKPSSDNSTK